MSDPRPNLQREHEIRSESSKYNAGTKANQQIHEERNTAANWAPIWRDLESGRAKDIMDAPKVQPHEPCLIVSSGPSLDDYIDRLGDWKRGVICSTSHATTLMRFGVEPDYIVVLDPFCNWGEISGVDWAKTKTKLILNPSVWPDILDHWPNEYYVYLQNIGRRDSYYATTQRHMFCRREPDTASERKPVFRPMIRTELTLFACTPPAQMFCAQILGYGPLFLAGCDYACTETKGRFTRWQPDASGEWQVDASPFVPTESTVLTDNGLYTEQQHLYYKKNHMSAWRLSLQQCYRIGEGSLTEVPRVNIDRVLRDQGEGFRELPQAEIIRRTERYLARVGGFVMRSDRGVSFVESANPLEDLPRYMAEGMQRWRCPRCGFEGRAADNADHAGEQCAQCGNVGMQRLITFDVEANMERITRLVRDAERINARYAAAHAGSAGERSQSDKPALACVESAIGAGELVVVSAETSVEGV